MTETRRVAVLLGAGASFDAGIPLTADLTEQVLTSVNQPSDVREPWVKAINFVHAAMFNYAARDGSNPIGAVNIERLISALRLLRGREGHEAAPFVSSWRDPILPEGRVYADKWNSDRFVRNLSQALGIDGGDRGGRGAASRKDAIENIGYFIAEFADGAKRPVHRGDYRTADLRVLRLLGTLLRVRKPVDYLYPLVDLALAQPEGLDVVTLNYDLAVEQAASERSVPIERGVGDWPRERIRFDVAAQKLRLHKIHGSLDWELEAHSQSSTRLTVSDGAVEQPWIVVGDREKLATDGPTLELLHAAEEAIERADHLVIVGYRFADAHVNHVIRNWMLRSESRTVGVIEPTWSYPEPRSFFGQLVSEYGGSWRHDLSERPQRVFGYQGGARTQLPHALSTDPLSADTIVIADLSATAADNGAIFVEIEHGGRHLSHVGFRSNAGHVTPEFEGSDLSRVTTYDGVPSRVNSWPAGEKITLRIWPTQRYETLTLEIAGRTLTSELQTQVGLPLVRPAPDTA
ncbi:SIR2 family protein [Microbacterium sp. STF-2]|uniref:SIR2 family protein n=1 Tax=Microbacterium sp. STF-2 TaxID=3031132 RepID=UPI002AFF9BD0|nr:SIR2 family protein [Microbacterium sp. STF-2]MEA1264715.1 SIR2 family protein [Microbacterium sp. STF-2]